MEDNLKNMLGDYVTALEKENESLRKKCTDLELKIYDGQLSIFTDISKIKEE